MCAGQFGQLGQMMNQKNRGIADPEEKKKVTAADIPLGDGLLDAGRTSILNRRKKIEEALAEAGE